jgi:hypothetical protein
MERSDVRSPHSRMLLSAWRRYLFAAFVVIYGKLYAF